MGMNRAVRLAAGVLYCLFGLSTAISHQRLRLYEHAYSQLQAGTIDVHDKAVTYGFSLPGADQSIPIIFETSPKQDVINETAEFFPQRGSVRQKIRYGPFSMDSMDKHQGMIDYIQVGAQMPCSNCTITFMQASLEYPNGSYANANSSTWLHHCVLINLSRNDTVCGNNYYGHGQRWFASGNERTRVSFSLDGHTPTGYYIGPRDSMVFETELMNQAMFNQTVFVTITYEWIAGPQPDFYEVQPVWMDISGCIFASDMPVKTKPDFTEETVFSYSSPTYESAFNGVYLGMGGHLHDGGINIEIYKDMKYQLCNSVAEYGGTPGYIDEAGTSMVMPMNPSFSKMAHISAMTFCYSPIVVPTIAPGDLISITANYNFTEHMPMLTLDGDYDDIMGIVVIYTAVNMTQATLLSYVGNTTKPLEQNPPLTGMGGLGMMHSASDDDDDDSSSSSGGMSGMGGGMDMTAMKCVPMRDSPGTITLQNLNMTDDSTMTALLTAIMCDSCLQVWSAPYARYLWYGLAVVIALAGFARVATWQSHLARKHAASQMRFDVWEAPATVIAASTYFTRFVRKVAYPQITPTRIPEMFALPPLGVVLMILGYFGFVLGLQFSNASTGDLQTWQFLSVRAGWLSVAQLPLIVLLSTKRNFVTMLTAVTYERLNVMHRWTARALLMTALMHFGFQWHGWSNAGVVKYELSDDCIPTGAAALALVLWMNLSTLAPFRNLSYEFFVLQHLITFFGTIIAVAYHIPSTAPYALTYVYITSAIYLSSKLIQGVVFMYQQRRRSDATLTAVSSTITKVTVSPSPFKDWKAGSFARLTIPKLGLVQSHPATIASTPSSHSGDLVFYLLSRKGFTRNITRAERQSQQYRAILDGPYGGSQHDFAAFNTSVIISGSVGITYTLSLLLDLAHRSTRLQLPIRRLVFLWSIRSDELVKALRPEITAACESLLVAGVDVEINIHITGPTAKASLGSSDSSSASNASSEDVNEKRAETVEVTTSERSNSRDEIEKMPMQKYERALSDSSVALANRADGSKRLAVCAGRADLQDVLSAASVRCAGEMGVAVCGPRSMTTVVRNKVASMQFGAEGRKAGTYLHVEGFNW